MNHTNLTTLTKENLLKVIQLAVAKQISHRELVDWCSFRIQDVYNEDTLDNCSLSYNIADEIDAQWELFLSNTLPLGSLQTVDRDEIQMPGEWLEQWATKLK